MKIYDILKISNSNLVRNKLRTLLNILAIFVAAFTLCLTIGISNGLKNYIDILFKTIEAPTILSVSKLSPDGQSINVFSTTDIKEYVSSENSVNKDRFGSILYNYSDFEQLSKKIPEITSIEKESVLPINIEYLQFENQKKYTAEINIVNVGFKIKLNSGKEIIEKDEIIIPYKLLEKYNWDIKSALGKIIKFYVKNSENEYKVINLKVAGVSVNNISGSNIYISKAISKDILEYKYLNTPTYSLLNESKNESVSRVLINVDKVDNINKVKEKLKENGYEGQSFDDAQKTINEILTSLQYALIVFAAISLIAATFGIINTMIISVMERTKEIGLSKALGMSSSTVFSIFLLESTFLGFWGAITGIFSGILVGSIANKIASDTLLKDFPGYNLFLFDPINMIGILLGISIICLIAGAFPSIKASKLNPIEALKYE